MKFFHLADLHLGRLFFAASLLEDQQYILEQVLDLADREKPDAVLIAGDVYDRSVPSAEAESLFGSFLESLSQRGINVLVISGNHDSARRLSYAAGLLKNSGVYIAGEFGPQPQKVDLEDQYGPVRFHLLPFIKPVHVRVVFPEEEIHSYTDAVRSAISRMELLPQGRNVLLAHQFVTGAQLGDSEEVNVGGLDNVDGGVFSSFDYVALGHLHRPQDVGSEKLRYCGTPLKYSFSEENQEKSLTVVEMKEKGSLSVKTIPLRPLHEVRTMKGTYEELTARDYYKGTRTDDYLQAVLMDEEDVPGAMQKMRLIYPNLLHLQYGGRENEMPMEEEEGLDKRESPLELASSFYKKQSGKELSKAQEALLSGLVGKIWEEET